MECSCDAPGYCSRFDRMMSVGHWRQCKTNPGFHAVLTRAPKLEINQEEIDRDAERRTAFVNSQLRIPLPCIHRSEHPIQNAVCGCSLYDCAIHDECVVTRKKPDGIHHYKLKDGTHVCDECPDRRESPPPVPNVIQPDPFYALKHLLPAGIPTDAALQTALRGVCEQRTAMPDLQGRGIVYAAGGWRFMCGVFVSVRMLRWLGCEYPVEVWYNGDLPGEFEPEYLRIFDRLGVTFHDAAEALRRLDIRRRSSLGGWPLKPLAYLLSSFEEVLGLDADCYPVLDPRPLFDHPMYLERGAILWPDKGSHQHGAPLEPGQWERFGLADRKTPGIESGQILINKRIHWHSLSIVTWLNDHHDFCYLPNGPAGLLGDKDTFAIGFHAADEWGGSHSRRPYAIAPPCRWVHCAFLQNDLDGRTMFIHRCKDKPRIKAASYGTAQTSKSGTMLRCDRVGHYKPELAHEWKVHELVEHYRQLVDNKAIDQVIPAPAYSESKISVLVPMIYKPGLHPQLMESMRSNLAAMIQHCPRFHIDVVEFDEPFQNAELDRIWAKVARARNKVISHHLEQHHEYVLWIDADMVRYPPDLLNRLHEANPNGITAPAIMIEDDNKWYDWAAFVEMSPAGELLTFTPEHPYWRFPDRVENGQLELHGVGSLYLMPAWPYRRGIAHADTPWTDHWPICEAVRAGGERVICLTDVRADHAELPRYGEAWH